MEDLVQALRVQCRELCEYGADYDRLTTWAYRAFAHRPDAEDWLADRLY